MNLRMNLEKSEKFRDFILLYFYIYIGKVLFKNLQTEITTCLLNCKGIIMQPTSYDKQPINKV